MFRVTDTNSKVFRINRNLPEHQTVNETPYKTEFQTELKRKKINEYKAIYICPEHNDKYQKRKNWMDKLLRDLGFTQIEHYKSSNEKYPKCLNDATIEILENNLDKPFILLEDDVDFTGVDEIEINDEVDAIYLGISKFGGHPSNYIHDGPSKFYKFSDTQVRVINCLSAHAILYNSRKYKEEVIRHMKIRTNQSYPHDVLLSRLQKKFIILANKTPSFYQSNRFNTIDQEKFTKFEINI